MSLFKNKIFEFLFKRHYSSSTIIAFDILISIVLIYLYYLNGIDNFKQINYGSLFILSSINVLNLLIFGNYNSYIRYLNLKETLSIFSAFITSIFVNIFLYNYSLIDSRFTINDIIIIETLFFSSIIIFRFIIKSLFDSISVKNIEIVSVYGPIKNLENISQSLTTNEISIELYITFDKTNKSRFYGKKLVNIDDNFEELIDKYGISRIIIDKDCDSESTKKIYERIKLNN